MRIAAGFCFTVGLGYGYLGLKRNSIAEGGLRLACLVGSIGLIAVGTAFWFLDG